MADADITLLARTNGLKRGRLGLAIAKKQLPRAVARNRVKRLARESFRRNKDALSGMDVVVLVRGSIASRDNAHVQAQFEALWRKLVNKCKD